MSRLYVDYAHVPRYHRCYLRGQLEVAAEEQEEEEEWATTEEEEEEEE